MTNRAAVLRRRLFAWLNASPLKRLFHRALFQNRSLMRVLGFRMPPLDHSARFGSHYADLSTLLMYRSLSRILRRQPLRTAHEIGVGVYGTLAIAIVKRFQTLELTTSSIAANEVESAYRTGRENGIELTCIESDVLDQVEGSFDLLWWNLPYYDPQILEYLDRLFRQVRERGSLTPSGRLVLGINTIPLPIDSVRLLLSEHPHLQIDVIERFWWNPHCVLTLESAMTLPAPGATTGTPGSA